MSVIEVFIKRMKRQGVDFQNANNWQRDYIKMYSKFLQNNMEKEENPKKN